MAIVLLAAILVPFAVWAESFERLASSALTGTRDWIALAVIALLAADVLLPVPSSLVSTSAGALLGWAFGTAASAIGMTLGCLIAYWLGRSGGRRSVGKWVGDAEMARFDALFTRVGAWAIVIARPVPVLAECSAFLSGVNAFPAWRFTVLTAASNIAISGIYAALGAAIGSTIGR